MSTEENPAAVDGAGGTGPTSITRQGVKAQRELVRPGSMQANDGAGGTGPTINLDDRTVSAHKPLLGDGVTSEDGAGGTGPTGPPPPPDSQPRTR